MARYVVGDPVTLTATFTVDGTATDPTTVTLEVTDPSGTTDTYTYGAAEITKSSTGVYTKTVTADERGTWTYLWSGTGTAADLQDGTFEVYPSAAVDGLDVLTFGEAKDALNMDRTGSDANDPRIRQWITAVSRRFDERCGPVVQRTVTDEAHDGGVATVWPRKTPVKSVSSVVEYDDTDETTLTAETNATKTADNFLLDDRGGHYQAVRRRDTNGDGTFPAGRRNVLVTYVSGRYVDTESVDPQFKLAAGAALRRLWHREAGAWARGGDPFAITETGPVGMFRVIDPVIDELLREHLKPPVAV